MKQTLLKSMGIAAIAALALTGCGGDTDATTSESAAGVNQADYNPQPRENLKEGGEVHFGINEIPEQLNAMNSDGSADTARVWSWYMPQILLMDPDGTVKKNDAYLDDYKKEVVDGNTTVTLTFTEKAHWNDGTDMDWTAVDATWKANRSYDEGFNPNATDGYKAIKSVAQGDSAKTAVVTFDGEFAWPDMPFVGALLHPKISTPEIFNKAFIDNPNSELYGAGPYRVKEFDAKSDYISFEPNPEWWGNKPLLDLVSFQGYDASASINAFKNGEIDMVGTNTKDRLAQVADMTDVVTYRAMQTANTLLQVDADKPVFKDINVRKAFFMASIVTSRRPLPGTA